jgi:hypothetical protein
MDAAGDKMDPQMDRSDDDGAIPTRIIRAKN